MVYLTLCVKFLKGNKALAINYSVSGIYIYDLMNKIMLLSFFASDLPRSFDHLIVYKLSEIQLSKTYNYQ